MHCPNSKFPKSFWVVALGSILAGQLGCQPDGTIEGEVRKKPRPIATMVLKNEPPPTIASVSASVASWKTEQIGFEVSGRVEWVIEPGNDVEGRLLDDEGNQLIEGTPIARIDDERYRLQFESAKAEVARAEQSVASIEIELDRSLPAQMRAATAELALAERELNRSKRLFDKDAGAEADVDRDQANFENAQSRIDQLKATMKAKEAERISLKLQKDKAEQALDDAQRSLNDCTLYSSFRGQIADVSVVPGSVVSPGQPVATVQMMDPIKIEVEVSAEDSRRLRKRQRIPVIVPLPDGSEETKDGFLYLIDPVADPQLRTYTLTLLMLNERNVDESEEFSGLPYADQTWRLDFKFLPGAEEGKLYAAKRAILEDDEGPYLWKVNGLRVDQNLPKDNVIEVEKLRIELGETSFPFLGNWVFQEIIVKDSSFVAEETLVVGRLTTPAGEPNQWNGDRVRIVRDSQWKVRPGDLVSVDLSDGTSEPGIYVPMDAVVREESSTFLFFVETEDGQSVVRKRPVTLAEGDQSVSELVHIQSSEAQSLEGAVIATRGAHYLRDGEFVRPSAEGAEQ